MDPAFRIPLTILIILAVSGGTLADCPHVCECKWKSGKESVSCINANLTFIPSKLDAGTQVLDLTGNEIPSIDREAFSRVNLLNLQRLFIVRCRLKTLDKYAFRDLINLVELDMSHNALTSIPSHAFSSISELRELKLNGNPIQRLPTDAFSHLPQLVRLELSDCKIYIIDTKAFASLETTLEWLNLDGNRMTDVRSSSLTVLYNLHGLELGRNSWNCSCALRPLREWMLKQKIPSTVVPLCRSPPRLAGRAWDRLELDDFACTPHILATRINADAVEGRNVTMSCLVGGIPEPNVKWILRNRILGNSSSGLALSSSTVRRSYVVQVRRNISNLTITGTETQDAGTYVCMAENKAGRAEASVTLTVARRPPENSLSGRILVASVVVAILFVISSLLVAVCLVAVRRNRKLKAWSHHSTTRRESYEKIEMKSKTTGNLPNLNQHKSPRAGETLNMMAAKLTGAENGIAFVGATAAAQRRHGDYRNVPSEDDGTGYEDNIETNPIRREIPTAAKWKIISSQPPLVDTQPPPVSSGFAPPGCEDADLHIPRIDCRNGQFSNSLVSASSGAVSSQKTHYAKAVSSAASVSGFKPATWSQHVMKKQMITPTIYPDAQHRRSPSGAESTEIDMEKGYPDLLEITRSKSPAATSSNFCTLPRKRLGGNAKYFSRNASTDSQSPLLPECPSRYGSETLDDVSMISSSSRRLSAESQPLTGRYPQQRSNSFLNLVSPGTTKQYPSLPTSPTKEAKRLMSPGATPLLDFSALPARSPLVQTPSSSSTVATSSAYDYHAAQLERFLEEYRSLQEQLCKMKETCETIRRKEMPPKAGAAKLADPLMYNAAVLHPTPSANLLGDESTTKSILKNKSLLPGQPPEPPPYWLHRNALLKKLNDPNSDQHLFKS
ncbi:Leucine-rich repeat [Sergentomyia squamirostris]